MNINVELVKKLITEQFPNWHSLPISPISQSGYDNFTFHLGEEMLVRLPKDEEHAPPILKEYKWLNILSKKLSLPIPTPIALGKPSALYPWHFSINRWLDGENASKKNIKDMNLFAKNLGDFLHMFQGIDATGGPEAGAHNFYRGGSIAVYDAEVKAMIPKIINADEKTIAINLWQDVMSSNFEKAPVWVHGDLLLLNAPSVPLEGLMVKVFTLRIYCNPLILKW